MPEEKTVWSLPVRKKPNLYPHMDDIIYNLKKKVVLDKSVR